MIAHIKGKIIHKSPESVIVDVGGVGYEVHIPLSTYYKLPDVEEYVSLNTHTHIREDAMQLYGFFTQREKEIFQMLIAVSGVGPKLARNILSGIPADDLVTAVSSSDIARLKAIPGIGGKTAERLIVELKDKMTVINRSQESGVRSQEYDVMSRDVLSALVNLGYKWALAEKAIEKVRKTNTGAVFEVLLKESLKALANG
ncbi:MAG: Holliday junction DNA helicase RuvA [Deltaproteobacteria bacterium RIFCSPLOWO2_12_FULL_43_16]|nr:MAG: Holliday junction DNA helicase RuvA [Deltaproteobacteria bacterium GWA2_43_19]OGQ12418.1 MAG: Holliday junction DNA helicase RuvA [Deltaproteobacteria bacterium RIFCSPHIGHO2_02_FULL_43_33]OGQ59391.1 MAG: Holliday junction DNA helicase RuvA [Deltaproteobacteria bacterium RIFCSPLOWO2_12_FULL_43_16]HBR18037.1 Holliday junction branch migration protein RuvA [Deltaproteobacteria bacterium]